MPARFLMKQLSSKPTRNSPSTVPSSTPCRNPSTRTSTKPCRNCDKRASVNTHQSRRIHEAALQIRPRLPACRDRVGLRPVPQEVANKRYTFLQCLFLKPDEQRDAYLNAMVAMYPKNGIRPRWMLISWGQ